MYKRQVPAAFLSRLCEYEITAVIAVQSIFNVVVVGLAEVNTVLLVNRSREFVIAYLAPDVYKRQMHHLSSCPEGKSHLWDRHSMSRPGKVLRVASN